MWKGCGRGVDEILARAERPETLILEWQLAQPCYTEAPGLRALGAITPNQERL